METAIMIFFLNRPSKFLKVERKDGPVNMLENFDRKSDSDVNLFVS